jgi:hypothetical protein
MAVSPSLGSQFDGTNGTLPFGTRAALEGLLAGSWGNFTSGRLAGMQVQGASAWTYTVQPGVYAFQRAAGDGVHLIPNSAAVSVATTGAPTTGSRIDIIYVTQPDPGVAGSSSMPSLGVVQGTAGTTPSAPALPANSGEIARATIAAGSTSTASAPIMQSQALTSRGGISVFPSLAAANAYSSTSTDPLDAIFALIPANGIYAGIVPALWQNVGTGWKPVHLPPFETSVFWDTSFTGTPGPLGTTTIAAGDIPLAASILVNGAVGFNATAPGGAFSVTCASSTGTLTSISGARAVWAPAGQFVAYSGTYRLTLPANTTTTLTFNGNGLTTGGNYYTGGAEILIRQAY